MTSDCVNVNKKKQVIIIGNGPSAITLSYILAGNWPYYNVNHPHPNEQLHHKLTHPPPTDRRKDKSSNYDSILVQDEEDELQVDDTTDRNDEVMDDNLPSLLNYDLEYLCSGLEGRSINPVSVLLDTLQFPNADFGMNKGSSLKWKFDPNNTVEHLVIGQGNPGGSWNSMVTCDETYTVSFSQWMQLPNLSINETKYGQKVTSDTESECQRISLANVAKYFKYYVASQQLTKYFVNNAIVTSVQFNEKNQLWHVSGWQKNRGSFNYWAENIVLATGNNDLPNRLKVRGEGYPFVLHSIVEMEKILTDAKNCNLRDPVLIIGSGLSAADAIITCKQHKIPVKHVFRRHPDDPALIFNQLPENMYPEYHSVHENMKRPFNNSHASSNGSHSLTPEYTSFPMHSVAEIRKNKEVILTNLLKPDDCSTLPCRTTVKVSYVLTLIGRRPELSFIKPKELRSQLPMFPETAINSRSNPLRIHPYTHECISQRNLYAMGPLVGDNFVRFVQGAALAIARDIIFKPTRESNDKKDQQL